jgi:hypothetical protein
MAASAATDQAGMVVMALAAGRVGLIDNKKRSPLIKSGLFGLRALLSSAANFLT